MRRRLLRVAALVSLGVGVLLPANAAAKPPGGGGSSVWTCTAGYVALTFDDGPDLSSGNNTPQIVATLTSYGVHATFFEVGENVTARPDLTALVAAAGNPVANHSYDHADLATLTSALVTDELTRTSAAIGAAGVASPTLFRPPYGSTNDVVRADAEALGMTEVLWNVDPRDWNAKSTTSVVSKVMRGVRPGSIVLMHDGWTRYTVAAVPQILQQLRSRGYCPGLIARSPTWDWSLRGFTVVVPDPTGPHP